MLSTIVWSVASFLMNLVLNYPIKVDTHFNIIGISCFGVIHDASIAMSTIVRHATFISKVQCSSISNILTHDDLLLSSIIKPWFFLLDVLAHECIFWDFFFFLCFLLRRSLLQLLFRSFLYNLHVLTFIKLGFRATSYLLKKCFEMIIYSIYYPKSGTCSLCVYLSSNSNASQRNYMKVIHLWTNIY